MEEDLERRAQIVHGRYCIKNSGWKGAGGRIVHSIDLQMMDGKKEGLGWESERFIGDC